MADSGGDTATCATHKAGVLPFHSLSQIILPPAPAAARPAKRWVIISLQVAAVAWLVGCGVQAPPLPPRVQNPQPVTDLRAAQVGRTIEIAFTLPELAADGEQLTKPVTIDIFRAISPAGQKPEAPDTSAAPWLSLPPGELPRYLRHGKVDYPFQLSPQEFHERQGSTFSFAVVAFTRGFRGRPHRSEPSSVAQVALLDVARPVTNLAVKVTETSLLLSWDKPAENVTGAPAHLSGYRIYLSSTGKPGSFELVGQADSTHFEDKTFQFGRQYYFQVSAVTAANGTTAESEHSLPVSLTPRDVFPPPVPTGLSAVNAAGAIDLLWTASTASDLAGYNVYRSDSGGPFERVNKQIVPTPIFHDTAVAPGHDYQYAVTAVDLSGNESRKSVAASISTPAAGAQ